MREFSAEKRQQLAIELRRARRIERNRVMTDPQLNTKRNRPAHLYIEHLNGLTATLEHVQTLPAKHLVDVGAGTTRATAELARSVFGENLTFTGVGILWEPTIMDHLGSTRYRITPAQCMRGFQDGSVGGMISVYGPYEHSVFIAELLDRAYECLTPGGVIKICIMKHIPSVPERNVQHDARCNEVHRAFEASSFQFVWMDREFQNPRIGPFKTQRGFNRIYLGIKPSDRQSQQVTAEDLLHRDAETMQTMKRSFPEPL